MPPTASPIPRQRLDAARRMARVVADGLRSSYAATTRCAQRFGPSRRKATASCSTTISACRTNRCWLHAFVAHAARYGLRYLADADLRTMNAAGIDAEGRALLAHARSGHARAVSRLRAAAPLPPVAAVPRRRGHPGAGSASAAGDARIRRSFAGARRGGRQGRGPRARARPRRGGRRPRAGAAGRATRRSGRHRSPCPRCPSTARCRRPLESILIRAFVASIVALHIASAGRRRGGRRASASERARAATRPRRNRTSPASSTRACGLPDADARRLLAMLDGETDRAALARAMTDPARGVDAVRAKTFVDDTLGEFARLALLVG